MKNDNSTFIHNIKALILLEPFLVLFVLKKFVADLDDLFTYGIFAALMLGSIVTVIVLGRVQKKKE